MLCSILLFFICQSLTSAMSKIPMGTSSVVVTGQTCCANYFKKTFYDNDDLGVSFNKGINSFKTCYRMCNAMNDAGKKICHGFSYEDGHKYCRIYLNLRKNFTVSLPCSKDDPRLEYRDEYDYYCNIYCEKEANATLPPEKCPPYPTTTLTTTTTSPTTTTTTTTTPTTTTTTESASFEKACLSIIAHKTFYYQESCFVERKEKKTFKKAKTSCSDMSPHYPKGHLAHTKNEEIFNLFEKHFTLGTHYVNYFLGFAQKDKNDEPAGHWYWIDSDGKLTESADEIIKPLWNTNEPNNYENKEDCGDYEYGSGNPDRHKLNDVSCQASQFFICQYSGFTIL